MRNAIATLLHIPDEAREFAQQEHNARVAKAKAMNCQWDWHHYSRPAKELRAWCRRTIRQRLKPLRGEVIGTAEITQYEYGPPPVNYNGTDSDMSLAVTVEAYTPHRNTVQVTLRSTARIKTFEELENHIEEFAKRALAYFAADK